MRPLRQVKVPRDLAQDRHPNSGPCQRCWKDTAPRYGNGFGQGASAFCDECRPAVQAEIDAERARQREAKVR